MFEGIMKFFKKFSKEAGADSKDMAKQRLHLVLMQDRANMSVDFLELMKQEIIEVIKKYIDVDENAIDVKLTNKVNGDGTTGAPALFANIPIVSIKEETKKIVIEKPEEEKKQEEKIEEPEKEETSKIEEVEITEELEEKEEQKEEVKEVEEKIEEVVEEEKDEETKKEESVETK